MKILADLRVGTLALPAKTYLISNNIRTLRDGTRKSYEVVRSIPYGYPYDPQHFPKGLWSVTGVSWQQDKHFDLNTYGPVKIMTDAWQMVEAWELDDEGDYFRGTSRMVKDTCYWIHASVFNTTLGCIRLASPADAIEIATKVVDAIGQGDVVTLEVV
jgi:hypothetical protein